MVPLRRGRIGPGRMSSVSDSNTGRGSVELSPIERPAVPDGLVYFAVRVTGGRLQNRRCQVARYQDDSPAGVISETEMTIRPVLSVVTPPTVGVN